MSITVSVNGEAIILPKEISHLSDFITWKKISEKGTAVALNGRIVMKEKWPLTNLNDNDSLTIISAAFGG